MFLNRTPVTDDHIKYRSGNDPKLYYFGLSPNPNKRNVENSR